MYEAYQKDIDRISLISEKEKKELDDLIRKYRGKEDKRSEKILAETRQKLVLSCTRLIINIANELYWKATLYTDDPVDFDEILQMCNFEAVRASHFYNPDKGSSFASYASNVFIRRNVGYALGKINLDKIRHINMPHMVYDEEDDAVNEGHHKERLNTLELDSRFEEEGPTLGDITKDSKVEQPLEILEGKDLVEKVLEATNSLNKYQRSLLRRRYGLGNYHVHKFREIGKHYKKTAEWARRELLLAERRLQNIMYRLTA